MKKFFAVNLILFFAFLPMVVFAQDDTVGFSITPPLMNINLSPKEEWTTKIKVISNTSRPLKLYVEVVDFRGQGNGQLEFLDSEGIKNDPGAVNSYLSRWVTLAKEEIDLEPYRSAEIPFVISVPAEANPGGHYAAILIGTNPPDEKTEGSVVKISSKISSLILARVSGEVNEKGFIREFSPAKKFSGLAETNFIVRFQNQGNIHLRPRGTIKVFDMFGKQKGGDLEFNSSKDFGNVLPGGDREWTDLKWQDKDFLLLNRYKAELSLSFGEETKQTDVRYTFFWAVNWKWLIISLVSLIVFITLLLLLVKFYVRQSVKNLQREMGPGTIRSTPVATKLPAKKRVVRNKIETTEKKIVDLRKK
jgi:hypothetical protein